MSTDSYRTLQAPQNSNSIVKPGELVDVREISPLSLNDRKIFNLLIQNAGNNIDKPVEHVIEKKALRFGDHNVNDRTGESIEKLMAAVATIKVTRDGEPATQRVSLLASNVEHDRADGKFYYSFAPELRVIMKDSTMFARLHRDVMLSFTSKYALALYEMVMKRINMTRKSDEVFPILDFRALLGVQKGRLAVWSNLWNRAIVPAVEEVNHRGLVHVQIEGIKTGRKYTHVRMKWWRASGDKIDDSVVELSRPALGRKARMRGEVDYLHVPRLRDRLRSQTLEKARNLLRPARLDIHVVMEDWEATAEAKGLPQSIDGSFIGACKKALEKAKANN
jgi:Initiator Replication protein, WH1/Initiator Rep protein, WH2